MAINIPLKAAEPTDILDALGKYAALHQARVASQFAQPNAQANLDKLKALIEQTNLGNQESKLKMPFVAPKEKAGLQKLLADIAHTQTETSYIPTKYSQAAERLGIEQRRFSPEQLDALLKYRKALTETMPTKNLTAFGKAALEQSNVQKGLLPTGQQGQLANEQNIQNLTPEQQQLVNQYQLKRVKDTTDSALRAAFPQIESIDKTMESIPFETVSQFYGPSGQAKAAAEYIKSSSGKSLSPEYKAYKDFLTVKGPSLVAQMRQFLKDSVTPGAQEHIRGIVFPKKWTDNPTLALNQFKTLQDLYNIEKEARVRAANDPTLFMGRASKNEKQKFTAPTFKNEQEFRQWQKNASPEEISAYKQHLGIS